MSLEQHEVPLDAAPVAVFEDLVDAAGPAAEPLGVVLHEQALDQALRVRVLLEA